MTKAPIFSVIIPAFNGEKHVHKAIESILNQTFHDFELFLVDDCSTDQTLNILKSYQKKDNRIILLENKKNIGKPASLNRAIKKADGKYIALLDCDDVALPCRLEMQSSFFESNPEIKLTASLGYYITETDEVIGKIFSEFTDIDYVHSCLKNNRAIGLLAPSASFYRSVATEVGGFRDVFPCEDIDFWNRVLEKYPVVVQKEYLINYRIHSGSVTTSEFFRTKQNFRFVEHNMILRRSGGNELNLKEYLAYYARLPIRIKFRDKYEDCFQYLYRNAGFAFAKKNIIAALFQIALAFIMKPNYVLAKFFKQLIINKPNNVKN